MDEPMSTTSDDSSIGEAASGRGGGGGGGGGGGDESRESVSDEEDIYYIPERRPSLDLGTSPMDTGNWCFVEQALSPVQSYGTMTSEEDLAKGDIENGSPTGLHLERTDSFSSCYSVDSDNCEKKTLKVKSKDDVSQPSDNPELVQEPEEPLHPSYTVGFVFRAICGVLKKLPVSELDTFKWMLWNRYPDAFKSSPRSMDMVDIVDRLLECYSLGTSLKITKNLLSQMDQKSVIESLETSCITNEVCHDLREHLKKKYGEEDQDLTKPFHDLYTDLYISSIPNNGPNIEHEFMTIKKLNTISKRWKQISTRNIFDPLEEDEPPSNLVFLTGMPGSGKSMVFRKFIFDWIEEQSSMSILFPLTIRELKQFEDTQVSLMDMIQTIYPETVKLKLRDYGWDNEYKIVFVIDGLDELTKHTGFGKLEIHTDPFKATSLKVNLVNLFGGRLFFRAYCCVICRPHIKSWLAWDMHYDEREVRGFCEPEKDEYFKKRFEDPDQANRVIEYVKSFKTLHIMCHLPLFCSLVADECQQIFVEQGTQAELPRSLTYMYTKLLLALIHQSKFRAPFCEPGNEGEFLIKLGKLALSMLEKDEFIINKSDWVECGMSPGDEHNNSGLITQFTVTVHILYSEKVRCFIHPTMQEYLAALYAYLSFRNHGKNIFEQQLKNKFKGIFKGPQILELYKCAVEKSLQFENGKLDMFLCFLFGMAHKTNQELLHPFCSSSSKIADFTENAAAVIRKKMRDNPDRNSNLQRCLKELGV